MNNCCDSRQSGDIVIGNIVSCLHFVHKQEKHNNIIVSLIHYFYFHCPGEVTSLDVSLLSNQPI